MDSSEEETLYPMDLFFFEPESTMPISHAPSNLNQIYRNSTFFSFQEILEMSDVEANVHEKVLIYLKDTDKISNLKKWIVLRLKVDNYEACLCKTSWACTFGPPFTRVSTFGPPSVFEFTGNYEYIDVMVNDETESGGGDTKKTRLIIDMDFRSQFELVRPTLAYKELTNALPCIFVGTESKLNKIISLLCSAAGKSLKERGLHIPPWRRAGYMQSKWLSQNCEKF